MWMGLGRGMVREIHRGARRARRGSGDGSRGWGGGRRPRVLRAAWCWRWCRRPGGGGCGPAPWRSVAPFVLRVEIAGGVAPGAVGGRHGMRRTGRIQIRGQHPMHREGGWAGGTQGGTARGIRVHPRFPFLAEAKPHAPISQGTQRRASAAECARTPCTCYAGPVTPGRVGVKPRQEPMNRGDGARAPWEPWSRMANSIDDDRPISDNAAPRMAGVAQLVRAPGCGLGCRGFESHRSPHSPLDGARCA